MRCSQWFFFSVFLKTEILCPSSTVGVNWVSRWYLEDKTCCCSGFTDTSKHHSCFPTTRLSPITSSIRVPRWNHYQYPLQFRLIHVTCAALNLCTNWRQNNTAAQLWGERGTDAVFCFIGFLDRWALLVVQSQRGWEKHDFTLKCIALAYSSDNSRWQARLHNVCEREGERNVKVHREGKRGKV